ncbi:MAG: cellulose synthase subunit BcsC [bacterium ADurb.Bin243]|nr:MAG: cellulose synthase subunit BcsC [bacterium ADurb.Bin243]
MESIKKGKKAFCGGDRSKRIFIKIYFAAVSIAAIFILFHHAAPCAAEGRQPILSGGEETRVGGAGMKKYENAFYGFGLSYPKNYELSAKRGGAVTVTPKKNDNYRFLPALVISKYFVIKGQPLKAIIDQIEKKMSALPYYRLNYISKNAGGIETQSERTDEIKVCREFADAVSEETVYEVSLYKLKTEYLYEISWQVPRPFSNSPVAEDFERIAASFKILGAEGTAEVLAGAPVNTPAQILGEANSLSASGRFLEALALLKKAAQAGPASPDIHLLTAKCYTGLKDYKRAASSYEQLLKSYPSNLEFLNLYVDALIMGKDYKKALKFCKKALDLTGPQQAMAMAYINLGNVFLDMKMLTEALNSYSQGISRFPGSARLYNNAAYVYYLQRDYNSAADYYNKAISLDAGYKSAHLGAALVYVQKKDLAAASFHYSRVLKIDDRCEEAYIGLLKIYREMNMPKNYDELLNSLRAKNAGLYDRVVKKAR